MTKAEEGEGIVSSHEEEVTKEKTDVTKEKNVALAAPLRATAWPEQGATPTVVEGAGEITDAGASFIVHEALLGHGGESYQQALRERSVSPLAASQIAEEAPPAAASPPQGTRRLQIRTTAFSRIRPPGSRPMMFSVAWA
eukprot:9380976-Pyramimonas_sp.AAC.1